MGGISLFILDSNLAISFIMVAISGSNGGCSSSFGGFNEESVLISVNDAFNLS
jgi:hypothetical protein